MKVLLINPDGASQEGFSNPPLGLAYLAGELELHNIDVKIADGYLIGIDGILLEVDDYVPNIIGITCYTPGRINVMKIARSIKQKYPNMLIVLGGAHPTIQWKQILSVYPEIDICVLGEGEQTLLEIAQQKPLDQITGIAWRKNGETVKNPSRIYFDDLDKIPFPAWHLLDLLKYPPRGSGIVNGVDLAIEPRIPVIFSRGCTANCSFCSTWWIWQGHRCRSAGNMTDELELLNQKYDIKHFVFEDDAFSADIQAAKNLCQEIIKRKLNIVWYATTRVDAVDEELLTLMKNAGCYAISYGVETGSQKILDLMGKKVTVQKARETMIATKQAGIQSIALLIIGNRGETKETINETIDFLNQVNPDDVGYVGGLWIFPGTALYQAAKKEGLIDDSFWLTDRSMQVYLAEHSQKEIERYTYAIIHRTKIGSAGFYMGYPLEKIRPYAIKIPYFRKAYRKIKSLIM
jgi:anaerobic magnesium-protoporphyrin IX monomethyl ester cyclase